MGSEKFCLKWNDFETNISSAFCELRDDKDFFDVTLACDDEQIQAHKVILSACSPFFRNILRRNPHQNPLLYLKGVKFTDLQSVLNFMYHGEVNVAQEELNSFLAVAEDLRVKGLTQNNSKKSKTKDIPSPLQTAAVTTRPPDHDTIPPLKRPRPIHVPPTTTTSYHHEEENIQEIIPVKTEPQDHPLPPTPAHLPQPAPSMEQHEGQLQQVDDSMYGADESYEDYGGYDTHQGYEAAEGMEDHTKGFSPDLSGLSLEEATEKGLTKLGPGSVVCLVCGKDCHSYQSAKNHFEAMHFESSGYNCEFCPKFMKTKHALDCHISRNHRTEKQQAKLQGLF